jgi:hypothetical protein
VSPAGRPKGSKNAVSRPHQITVRLTEDERGWLLSKVTAKKTESDVVRELIDDARKREERRGG